MGLRRVLAQSRALVRKMLARPEQGDRAHPAGCEANEAATSLVLADGSRPDGRQVGGADLPLSAPEQRARRQAGDFPLSRPWLSDPRDRPDRPKAEMAMHPGDEPSRLDRVKGIVHSRRTLRNDLIQP